jgi:ATP-dependent DNA ligase
LGLYQTVGRCGTGFSDAELAALPARLAPLIRAERPARVDSRVPADVWFEPSLVLEVLSAENLQGGSSISVQQAALAFHLAVRRF